MASHRELLAATPRALNADDSPSCVSSTTFSYLTAVLETEDVIFARNIEHAHILCRFLRRASDVLGVEGGSELGITKAISALSAKYSRSIDNVQD